MKPIIYLLLAWVCLTSPLYGQAPAHDDCSNAILIPVPDDAYGVSPDDNGLWTGDLPQDYIDIGEATLQSGEYIPSGFTINGLSPVKSVWYIFEQKSIVNRDVRAYITREDLMNADDCGLIIYNIENGSCNFSSSNIVASLNQTAIPVISLPKGTYYVQVFGNENAIGNIRLNFEVLECSLVDGDFQTDSLYLEFGSYTDTYYSGSIAFETKCLSLEDGEDVCQVGDWKSMWVKFTIPATVRDGFTVSLSENGAYYDSLLLRIWKDSAFVAENLILSSASTDSCVILDGYTSSQLGSCDSFPEITYHAQILYDKRANFKSYFSVNYTVYPAAAQYPSPETSKGFGSLEMDSLYTYTDTLDCHSYLNSCRLEGQESKEYPSTFSTFTLEEESIVEIIGQAQDPGYNSIGVTVYAGSKADTILTDDLVCVEPLCGEIPLESYNSLIGRCHWMAKLPAGVYTAQTYNYNTTPIGIDVSIQRRVFTPIANEPKLASYISVGADEAITLVTESFNNIGDSYDSIISPCTGGECDSTRYTKITYFGFDLTEPVLAKFSLSDDLEIGGGGFNPTLFKLYKNLSLPEDTTLLETVIPLAACDDNYAFCNLQPARYTAVYFSDYTNRPVSFYLKTEALCMSKYDTITKAYSFGLEPSNRSEQDAFCCGSEDASEDAPVTTAGESWYTFTACQQGNFTVYQSGGTYIELYESLLDTAILITDQNSSNLYRIGYDRSSIQIYDCNTPCKRYYVKVIGNSNTYITTYVYFYPYTEPGDNPENAIAIPMNSASTVIRTARVNCHTLSPSTDYREGDINDAFTSTLTDFQDNYKSTFFILDNTNSQKMDITYSLVLSLDDDADVRYRIMKTSIINSKIRILGEMATSNVANSSIELPCMNAGDYLVQVISKKTCKGTIGVKASSTVNTDPNACQVNFCSADGSYTWTNAGGDRDWDNPANWQEGTVPDFRKNVLIPTLVATPIITSTALAASITIETGLQIQENGELILNRDWINNSPQTQFGGTVVFAGCVKQYIKGNTSTTFSKVEIDNATHVELQKATKVKYLLNLIEGDLYSNGYLTLPSDATTTAMVTQADNSEVIGNTTVQRYVDGTLNGIGYHYFGSPIQDASINSVFATNMTLVCNQVFNSAINPAYVRPFPTFYVYDETKAGEVRGTGIHQYDAFMAGWQVPDCSGNMEVSKGYIAHIRKGKTLQFVGTLNYGTKSRYITKGTTGTDRGWILMGNPYPSPLDWDLLIADGTNSSLLEDALYLRIATGRYSGTWASYVNGVGVNGGSQYIALGQGFMVKSKGNGTIYLKNSFRPTSFQNPKFLRTEKNQKQGVFKLALQKGDEEADETAIYFQEDATEGFDDRYDALKVQTNSSVTLYTSIENNKVSINAFPTFSTQMEIPLSYYVPGQGEYSFNVTEIQDFAEGSYIFLEDKTKKTITDLQKIPSYTFQVDKEGINTERFVLRFIAPLPELNDANVILYPNPTDGDVKIQFANKYEGLVKIRVLNMAGKEVFVNTTYKNPLHWETLLPISEWSQGFYVVEILTDKQRLVRKVVRK